MQNGGIFRRHLTLPPHPIDWNRAKSPGDLVMELMKSKVGRKSQSAHP